MRNRHKTLLRDHSVPEVCLKTCPRHYSVSAVPETHAVQGPNRPHIQTNGDSDVTKQEDTPNEPEQDYDSDTMILLDDVKSQPEANKTIPPKNVVISSVKTKTFGIKKPMQKKRMRNYHCPICKNNHSKLSDLNDHYKLAHPPLYCPDCDKEFCMPSSLERHSYIHKDLKFKCDRCSKHFPFESDQDAHMLSRMKTKGHHCVSPNCGKCFFSKGDLTKHIKTHSAKIWKCQLCVYTNKNKCNLKAHMRVHSNL